MSCRVFHESRAERKLRARRAALRWARKGINVPYEGGIKHPAAQRCITLAMNARTTTAAARLYALADWIDTNL